MRARYVAILAAGAAGLLVLAFIALQWVSHGGMAHDHGASAGPLQAPNVVEISPRLVTSGQPSAAGLATLKSQGFDAVIYLAPPTVPDAVGDEPLIVAKQGLAYVNIPIRFDDPTEEDFRRFAAVLQAFGERKVLVHCQVNMRASVMTFLYRVVVRKEPPGPAYDAVSKVWTPQGAWRRLIDAQLRKHGVAFEPL
jgi:protein tyrosine phosphatase (PTP) superfamily phosphohydrolase (DUF442 family)